MFIWEGVTLWKRTEGGFLFDVSEAVMDSGQWAEQCHPSPGVVAEPGGGNRLIFGQKTMLTHTHTVVAILDMATQFLTVTRLKPIGSHTSGWTSQSHLFFSSSCSQHAQTDRQKDWTCFQFPLCSATGGKQSFHFVSNFLEQSWGLGSSYKQAGLSICSWQSFCPRFVSGRVQFNPDFPLTPTSCSQRSFPQNKPNAPANWDLLYPNTPLGATLSSTWYSAKTQTVSRLSAVWWRLKEPYIIAALRTQNRCRTFGDNRGGGQTAKNLKNENAFSSWFSFTGVTSRAAVWTWPLWNKCWEVRLELF